MLNFQCEFCDTDIQSDYAYIGEFVQCPICTSYLIVPDPILPFQSDFHGYIIETMRASTLLWNTYEVSAQESKGKKALSLLKVPSTFFLKHVSNFEDFSNTVIKSGSMNVAGIPHLKDYSITTGKVYFLFEHFKSYNLDSFISKNGRLDVYMTLKIVRNIANSLNQVWNKNATIHQNLLPGNIRINNQLETRVMDIGISRYLLWDQSLLAQGFNIWDQRYMSPEFATQGIGDSPSCDIYALGAILYYMLTGKHPYMDVAPEAIPLSPIPEITSEVPPQIIYLIQRMMAKQASERLQTWDEVITRIDSITTKNKRAAGDIKLTKLYSNAEHHTGRNKPIGLSWNSKNTNTEKIKIRNAAAKKSKMTDTVAKLAKPELRAINSTWKKMKRTSKAKESTLKSNIALMVVLALALFIALPILFFIFKKQSAKAQIASKQASLRQEIKKKKTDRKISETVKSALRKRRLPAGTNSRNTYIAAIQKIDDFYKKNPEKLQETILQYDNLSTKAFYAGRNDIVKSIQQILVPLEKELKQNTDEKIKIVISELNKKVEPLLKAENFDEAIAVINNYDGEMAEETAFTRNRIVQKIQKIKNTSESNKKEIKSDLEELTKTLAPQLMNKQFFEAEIQMKLQKASNKSQIPPAVIDDFSKQIAIYEKLSQKLTTGSQVDDIIKENVQNPGDNHLLKGLMFYENNQYSEALVEFENLPYSCGRYFITAVKKKMDAAATETIYQTSLAEFVKVLNKYTFKFDSENPDKLLLQLTRKKISKSDAAELLEKINDFSDKKNHKAFVEKFNHIFIALGVYCKRRMGSEALNKISSGKLVRLTPEDDLPAIFKQAKSGQSFILKAGNYNSEQIQLNTPGILLKGETKGVIISCDTFSVNANDTKISNLTFKDTEFNIQQAASFIMENCIIENRTLNITNAAKITISNSMFNGITVTNSDNINFNHCTMLSGTNSPLAAITIDSEEVHIKNSIIYGLQYGIIIHNKHSKKKNIVEKSLLFGEKGLLAYKTGEDAVSDENVMTKLSKLRRYILPKSNQYEPPQFTNSLKGNYRLVKGVPGSKDASDRNDCGVVWDDE